MNLREMLRDDPGATVELEITERETGRLIATAYAGPMVNGNVAVCVTFESHPPSRQDLDAVKQGLEQLMGKSADLTVSMNEPNAVRKVQRLMGGGQG